MINLVLGWLVFIIHLFSFMIQINSVLWNRNFTLSSCALSSLDGFLIISCAGWRSRPVLSPHVWAEPLRSGIIKNNQSAAGSRTECWTLNHSPALPTWTHSHKNQADICRIPKSNSTYSVKPTGMFKVVLDLMKFYNLTGTGEDSRGQDHWINLLKSRSWPRWRFTGRWVLGHLTCLGRFDSKRTRTDTSRSETAQCCWKYWKPVLPLFSFGGFIFLTFTDILSAATSGDAALVSPAATHWRRSPRSSSLFTSCLCPLWLCPV